MEDEERPNSLTSGLVTAGSSSLKDKPVDRSMECPFACPSLLPVQNDSQEEDSCCVDDKEEVGVEDVEGADPEYDR